jgi:palmitoyltransferase
VSYLYVCCKDPGFVKVIFKESDSIIKAKILTQCDLSNEASIITPQSPKKRTPRTQHLAVHRLGMESPKNSDYYTDSKESPAFSEGQPSQQQSDQGVESEEAEVEVDQTDELSAAHDVSGKPHGLQLIIERRFCTVCQLEQPIRAKHCKECKRCVALHDHHCPWLGICIGERNRRAFYWYLLAQNCELWWSVVHCLKLFETEPGFVLWIEANLMRVCVLVVLVFFTVMLSCLLTFHSYLACSNRTTCKS